MSFLYNFDIEFRPLPQFLSRLVSQICFIMANSLLRGMAWIVILILSIPMAAQKIYMVGDSHVGSKIYPKNIESTIKTKYPNAQLSYSYKNGLRFSTFESTSDIVRALVGFKPDIVVTNLGTNEAYTNRFSASKLKKGMESFYAFLKKKLPDVKLVLVTPYTNKLKLNGKFETNNNNRLAADEIIKFAKDHPDVYVVDANMEFGTKFIDSPKLIRDNVHLKVPGYEMLGKKVGEEMLAIPALWTK